MGDLTAGEAERTLAQSGMAEILERVQLHRVSKEGWAYAVHARRPGVATSMLVTPLSCHY